MTCSPARLAANKANSARSSGPRTESGKFRSRSNALTHSLTSKVVRTEEENQAVAAMESHGAAGWLIAEITVIQMRIDRAHEAEDRERDRAAERADTCWDEDRSREADRIGKGLARRPDRVVLRLRGTVQGCTWLIARWEWLHYATQRAGDWTKSQQALAFDLRGIPAEFRGPATAPVDQLALVERQIASLSQLRDALRRSDAFDQETTRMGLADGATPELARLIRYEAALHRRLRWCCDQVQQGPTPTATPPLPKPTPAPSPAAPARAEPRPEAKAIPPEVRLIELEQIMNRRFPMQVVPAPSPTLAVSIAPVGFPRT